MYTKDEIFDKILNYLDSAIMSGFFTEEEIKEINQLEKAYYIQTENAE